MRIALAGNPNSGKTTMYNALTGQNEKVGNWAGVTVEKKQRPIKKAYCAEQEVPVAVDLPGAYSMSPFTGEETVTAAYVRGEAPDVIVNIVDATNLGRSLFFTTQLLELGIPVVVALNKSDVNRRQQTELDRRLLAARLGCAVVETSAVGGSGLQELVNAAMDAVGREQAAPYHPAATDPTDRVAVRTADRARFAFVDSLVAEVEHRKESKGVSLNDRLDRILTNRILGIPIFALVMLLVFQISQTWLGTWIAEGYVFREGSENELVIPGLVTLLEALQGWVGGLLSELHPLLYALLVDGVIGGLIAVVGFLPLVMVMYFLIALLEDCGYMSRVAVVLDPIFKRVGLSGRSVIPFVITVGCAVPGIMASRTIRDERERRATAMLAPFMPCGAKIPVISLFAGAFFDNAGGVSALVYLLGIFLVFVGAWIVKRIAGRSAAHSYFIIELPDYKAPSLSGAFLTMCSRGWAYIVKAATVILLCNTAVQVMQSFTWGFAVADAAGDSILASIATPIAYLLFPVVGVLSWQLAAAAVTGFIAKENVVGTLAVCFVGLENLIDAEELAMLEGMGAEVAGVMAITKAAALAYLLFNLYTPPCFAAIGAMNVEMKSGKWLAAGIGLQLGVGYTVGYLVYTVGTLLTSPAALHLGGALAGLAAVAVFVGLLLWLMLKKPQDERAELALGKE